MGRPTAIASDAASVASVARVADSGAQGQLPPVEDVTRRTFNAPTQLSKLYDSGGQSGWSIHGVVCSGLSLTIFRVGSSVEVVVNQDTACLWCLSWLESRSHCTSMKDFHLSRWRAVGGSPSAIVQTQRAAVAQARGEQKEERSAPVGGVANRFRNNPNQAMRCAIGTGRINAGDC